MAFSEIGVNFSVGLLVEAHNTVGVSIKMSRQCTCYDVYLLSLQGTQTTMLMPWVVTILKRV